MELSGFLPPDDFWAMQARWEEQIRAGSGRLPLFRAVGWEGPVTLGAWQMDGSEGGVAHMTGAPFERPQIEVTTTTRDAEGVCRGRFLAVNGPPLDHVHLQRLHEAFDRLPRRTVSIRIDGTAADFTVWEGEGTWLAAGNHIGFGIAVVAQGPGKPAPEDLALETVADIEPLLASRRAQLRRMRGEG